MTNALATALGRALAQTRAGDPVAATRIIQAALVRPGSPAASGPDLRQQGVPHPALISAAVLKPSAGQPSPLPHRWSLGAAVESLRRGLPDGTRPMVLRGRAPAAPPIPAGARFETRRFSCPAGAREYRLYVPATLPEGPQGLLLMLHGCTQDADDFASGTQMNTIAEQHGLIVAYPNQMTVHNALACWNWFRPADQARGSGEPAILAGLATALRQEFKLSPERVFTAGLSAGGAMAAILGASYPEVFSAVGIHSGLPHGCAHDVASAFAAMRGDAGAGPADGARSVRTIVFHGSADATVHSSNADKIVRAAQAGSAQGSSRTTGRSPGGTAYARTVAVTHDGSVLTELWLLEGAGHAWSGGSSAGTYTDPNGPDASAEMVRFFCQIGQD
jgi:poly(hydroxyalkanoate) depolymerase family esterase